MALSVVVGELLAEMHLAGLYIWEATFLSLLVGLTFGATGPTLSR